jgi:hypothetical protein
MWKHTNIVSAAFIVAMLISCWPVHEAVVAQTKANVPKLQNTFALGEDAAKQLLLLIEPDKNGKISKQAWMKFTAEEFDRLDKDKKGELDARALRASLLANHARPENLGK